MHLPPGSRFDRLSDDWRRQRQEAGLQALLPQLPPLPPQMGTSGHLLLWPRKEGRKLIPMEQRLRAG